MLAALACVLVAMLCGAPPGFAEDGKKPAVITVATDDNYPPYIFRDEKGALQGIIKDRWDAWSRHTGIAVRFLAADWNVALKSVADGDADVIDTIFRTKEREKIFAFSAPYADLDVSIFFPRDLSGIADVRSLGGFTVGAKAGDACVDWLAGNGVSTVRTYPNYEAIVDALAARESLVACIDDPPAQYFLYKKGLQDGIRHTRPLYTGRFHWAVRKDETALFAIVEDGFRRIGPAEEAAIRERWIGLEVGEGPHWLAALQRHLPEVLVAFVALLAWTWTLRRQVTRKTRSLSRALADLAQSETRFREIFDNVNDAIFIHDPQTFGVVMVNRRAREMYGLGDMPVETLTVGQISEGNPPYSQDDAVAWMRKAAAGEPQVFEWLCKTWDGTRPFWTEIGMRRARLDAQRDCILVVVRDISERKAAQAGMEFLAHHDALTGLPNRRLLQDRVAQAIAFAERRQQGLALIFLDLDQFKAINDSLGHPAGDAMLRQVAERLCDCLRETDTVCRLGGDEFVVLLPDTDDADAISDVAAKIQIAVSAPMTVDGTDLSTTLSMGIATYPDDGVDFDTLFKKADIAMYQAKQSGRSTHRFFASRMNVDAKERLEMRGGLQRALDRGEFVLHYQPVISFADGRMVGVEALIRWNHPERGLVPPVDFVPVSEQNGLIVPIGDWALREACRQAAQWRREGRSLVVSVNLSALQFHRGNLEHTVIDALTESGLPPEFLDLELTESMLLREVDTVTAQTQSLSALGVKLSIDDFGTGYSSFAYLKRLHVDRLKIDQSFVRGLASDREDAAIVRAIIQMARSLKLETVAEGVEHADVAARLRLMQCDYAQGFLFGVPQPAAELAVATVA